MFRISYETKQKDSNLVCPPPQSSLCAPYFSSNYETEATPTSSFKRISPVLLAVLFFIYGLSKRWDASYVQSCFSQCVQIYGFFSNSTCPLGRGTLLGFGNPMEIPALNFAVSREQSGRFPNDGENRSSSSQKPINIKEAVGEKRVF